MAVAADRVCVLQRGPTRRSGRSGGLPGSGTPRKSTLTRQVSRNLRRASFRMSSRSAVIGIQRSSAAGRPDHCAAKIERCTAHGIDRIGMHMHMRLRGEGATERRHSGSLRVIRSEGLARFR
jgi:hypothetical protein